MCLKFRVREVVDYEDTRFSNVVIECLRNCFSLSMCGLLSQKIEVVTIFWHCPFNWKTTVNKVSLQELYGQGYLYLLQNCCIVANCCCSSFFSLGIFCTTPLICLKTSSSRSWRGWCARIYSYIEMLHCHDILYCTVGWCDIVLLREFVQVLFRKSSSWTSSARQNFPFF